jgi:hypothetical protein
MQFSVLFFLFFCKHPQHNFQGGKGGFGSQNHLMWIGADGVLCQINAGSTPPISGAHIDYT